MSAEYPKSLNRLMEMLACLPGIGKRSAERIVFHLLKMPAEETQAFGDAIGDIRNRIRQCRICFNLSDGEVCNICGDSQRDQSAICVVEQAKDLLNLESAGSWKGVYHVLGGHVAPLEGVEPEDLTIDALVKRVQTDSIREVCLATNPNLEGEETNLTLVKALEVYPVKMTRLARGLPAGSAIEYANRSVLVDAVAGRRNVT